MEKAAFSTFDSLKLFYRFYAARKPAGTLVILHGHGEHSGRYEKFSEQLKGQNLSLAAFDYRGHGQSEGIESHVNDFEEYFKDVSAFVDFIKAQYGVQNKIFLFGNSMGGLIATHWALRFPEQIQALILSSPCFGIPHQKWIQPFNHFLNLGIPGFQYRNPIYPPYLTHDQREVEKYKSDKLIRRKISIRLLEELLRYATQLEGKKNFNLPFPLFILMAGKEKIVDPAKTRRFYEKVSAPHKELTILPGFYHEVFNETGQDQAFSALNGYLTSTCN